jgi:hypothetical protein
MALVEVGLNAAMPQPVTNRSNTCGLSPPTAPKGEAEH